MQKYSRIATVTTKVCKGLRTTRGMNAKARDTNMKKWVNEK